MTPSFPEKILPLRMTPPNKIFLPNQKPGACARAFLFFLRSFGSDIDNHNLWPVKQPQGKPTVAHPPAYHQDASLLPVYAAVIFGKKALSRGINAPDPRKNELPAMGMPCQYQINIILSVFSGKPFGKVREKQLESFFLRKFLQKPAALPMIAHLVQPQNPKLLPCLLYTSPSPRD